MSETSISAVDAVKYGDELITRALEHKDFAMAGTLMNDTPYTWKQVDQFNGPIENYHRYMRHGLGWVSDTSFGPNVRASAPGWKKAPDAVVKPYDPKRGDIRGALDLFVVEGSSHVYALFQAGGFETTVSFHCAEINTTIWLYMSHWQWRSDEVVRTVGGIICGPSPYMKDYKGKPFTDKKMAKMWRDLMTATPAKKSNVFGISTGGVAHLSYPIGHSETEIQLSFTAAENTKFELRVSD